MQAVLPLDELRPWRCRNYSSPWQRGFQMEAVLPLDELRQTRPHMASTRAWPCKTLTKHFLCIFQEISPITTTARCPTSYRFEHKLVQLIVKSSWTKVTPFTCLVSFQDASFICGCTETRFFSTLSDAVPTTRRHDSPGTSFLCSYFLCITHTSSLTMRHSVIAFKYEPSRPQSVSHPWPSQLSVLATLRLRTK